jgi:hypothetical protein
MEIKENLEIIKKNSYALKFIKNQIPRICREAIKQNKAAL